MGSLFIHSVVILLLQTGVKSQGSCGERNVAGAVGGSVTLHVSYTGTRSISWTLVEKFENVASTRLGGELEIQSLRYEGRLRSSSDGSLTITNLQHEDQGTYLAQNRDLKCLFHVSVFTITRPEVTLTPSWGNLLSGDSVTLKCVTGSAAQDNQTFYWYKDEKILNITTRGFTLPSASGRDSGSYKCRTGSSDMSFPKRLEVTNADVVLQQDPSSTYAGGPLTLRCHSRSEYKVINTTFYKEGLKLQISANDSTLCINKSHRGDTGNYKCSQLLQSQDGAFFAESEQIYIYVKEITHIHPSTPLVPWRRPVVTLTPSRGNILPGDTVTLTCDTGPGIQDGIIYHWYFERIPLHNILQEYTIRSATQWNNGGYQCRFGSGEISFPTRLDVKKGTPVVTLMPNGGNLLPGDSVTLTCVAGPDNQDSRTYYWYKDEELFNITQRNFTIPSVSLRDNGVYMCRTRFSDQSLPVKLEVTNGATNERDTNGSSE